MMSSENNGSGLFGGLILGAGFAGLLLLPFILLRRYGFQVEAGGQLAQLRGRSRRNASDSVIAEAPEPLAAHKANKKTKRKVFGK